MCFAVAKLNKENAPNDASFTWNIRTYRPTYRLQFWSMYGIDK